MSVYQVKGVGEDMTVFDDKVEIKPRGLMGLASKGLKGTKTIHFAHITGLQHKRAGVTSGYLQFTVPGGNESKGGVFAAASDENTFMFTSKANDVIVEVKEFIEQRMREARQPGSAAGTSAAEELRKLADLKAEGLLSAEEFAQAKAKLLA